MTGDFLDISLKYYRLRKGAPEGLTIPASAGSSGPCPAVPSAPAPPSSTRCVAAPAPTIAPDGDRFKREQKNLQELCKRRFFYRPAFDIYGGVAGFFTYGPPGCALKNNIIRQWRQHFVIEENLLEIEDTCIMQHCVLKASGHVDRFNDFMVKDVEDESKFFRADKLLEEFMDEKLKAADLTPEQEQEYRSVRNQADAYSREELHGVFQKYGIKSPETGNDLSEPYEFNLMFPTPIGPGGYLQGYLRPETAQGIFLNYKFCCEQNSNRLPFGVAQVGRAFRNEIAPRAGLTRQREFTQAEIEFFVNPKCKTHPKFKGVSSEVLTLFHSKEQLAGQDPFHMTVGEAVQNGIINNEFLGYVIVRTYKFLLSLGVKKEFVRFRQHLPTEMAHYAADCWDAEIYTSLGWLESVGIADRAAFDLNAHATAAKCDLQYKEVLPEPIEKEVLAVTKASGIKVMKALKKDGKMVKEWLDNRSQGELEQMACCVQKGPVPIEVDGKSFSLNPTDLEFERKMEKTSVNAFVPGVIEPSFGIDRIFTAVLEHVHYARPDDEERGVLAFASSIAPHKLAILPLDQRIARHEQYTALLATLRPKMSALGLSYTADESGATVGRRYARNDELGIPFAMTFDFTTLEDGTVTLRERDSMGQIRLPLDETAELIQRLCVGEATWDEIFLRYPHKGGDGGFEPPSAS